MFPYAYRRGILHCGAVALPRIAERVGTPFYVYSAEAVRARFRRIARAFRPADPLICYSVKANGNLALLRLLAREGSGFDIVSEGDLYRVRRAGGKPGSVVFAGVGKTDEEIGAALRAGVYLFNAESEEEAARIDRLAFRRGDRPRVALRVNPDVDPKTHVYITTGKKENKFGLDLARAKGLLRRARRFRAARLVGLHVHIGSQIQTPGPYLRALRAIRPLFAEFPGGKPELIDLGGGFGISYEGGPGLDVEALGRAVVPEIRRVGCRLLLEPGRFAVASSGALVARVVAPKRSGAKTFVILDAGMNDLIRPSLYEAYHRIVPVRPRRGKILADIVGPICESGDFFAIDRRMPRVEAGDLLAILDAGAYGFAMASHYNARPNPAEVLVEGRRFRVIRRRESLRDLVRGED